MQERCHPLLMLNYTSTLISEEVNRWRRRERQAHSLMTWPVPATQAVSVPAQKAELGAPISMGVYCGVLVGEVEPLAVDETEFFCTGVRTGRPSPNSWVWLSSRGARMSATDSRLMTGSARVEVRRVGIRIKTVVENCMMADWTMVGFSAFDGCVDIGCES